MVVADLDDVLKHLRDGTGAVVDSQLPQPRNSKESVGIEHQPVLMFNLTGTCFDSESIKLTYYICMCLKLIYSLNYLGLSHCKDMGSHLSCLPRCTNSHCKFHPLQALPRTEKKN